MALGCWVSTVSCIVYSCEFVVTGLFHGGIIFTVSC